MATRSPTSSTTLHQPNSVKGRSVGHKHTRTNNYKLEFRFSISFRWCCFWWKRTVVSHFMENKMKIKYSFCGKEEEIARFCTLLLIRKHVCYLKRIHSTCTDYQCSFNFTQFRIIPKANMSRGSANFDAQLKFHLLVKLLNSLPFPLYSDFHCAICILAVIRLCFKRKYIDRSLERRLPMKINRISNWRISQSGFPLKIWPIRGTYVQQEVKYSPACLWEVKLITIKTQRSRSVWIFFSIVPTSSIHRRTWSVLWVLADGTWAVFFTFRQNVSIR